MTAVRCSGRYDRMKRSLGAVGECRAVAFAAWSGAADATSGGGAGCRA